MGIFRLAIPGIARQRVLQQIVSLGAGEGLARGLNWGLMALLPFALTSAQEYGSVGLLVSIELFVSGVSFVGIDRAILRFYAKEESPETFLRSALAIWAALAWVPLAAIVVLHLSGVEVLFSIPLAPHLFLLCGVAALVNLNMLCVSISRSLGNIAIFFRFRLCYAGLKFVGVLLLASQLGHSLSYVVGTGVAGIVMLIFIVPFLRGKVGDRTDRAIIGQILTYSWPLMFIMVSAQVFDYFSRFVLAFTNNTKDVGVFTFACTLGGGLFIFYAALATYFEPRIYSHADNKPRCEEWLMLYTNTCVAFASAGGATFFVLYPYISLYLPTDYGRELPTISIIMGTALLQPLYLQGNYRLSAYQNTGYLAATTFITACLSLALNLLLISRFGVWGAALAFYCSNLILAVCILAVSLRMAEIPSQHRYFIPTCVTSTLGSLLILTWAHRPEIVSIALLVVCIASSGLMFRTFVTIGEQSP